MAFWEGSKKKRNLNNNPTVCVINHTKMPSATFPNRVYVGYVKTLKFEDVEAQKKAMKPETLLFPWND